MRAAHRARRNSSSKSVQVKIRNLIQLRENALAREFIQRSDEAPREERNGILKLEKSYILSTENHHTYTHIAASQKNNEKHVELTHGVDSQVQGVFPRVRMTSRGNLASGR